MALEKDAGPGPVRQVRPKTEGWNQKLDAEGRPLLEFAAPRGAKPPVHLADLDIDERKGFVTDLGLPAFRAKQIATHYFTHYTSDPALMTDLPAAGREELERVIRNVLEMPRDPAKLRADVLEMRATMAQHKPAKGPLDVKLARGGLVDAEFIVHYLQLRDHVALEPAIPLALTELVAADKLDPAVPAAHRMLIAQGLGPHMELAKGYLQVLRKATAKNTDGPDGHSASQRKSPALI